MAELEIVEVYEGFACPAGSFRKGQLFRSDDPLVTKYPAQFRPIHLFSTRKESRVEQATAAPGEKRGAS